MTNFLKLASASVLALALTACASTDDKYSVGVDDNDQYSSTADGSDVELSDAQTFGMDDDDQFDATTDTKAEGVMFGGAMMYPNKTIVENASAANNLTTLVALVKQAQLVETLSSDGPFTVFAPTDTAFSYVPSETTTALMQDENRELLQGVLTYHVVAGKITAADLIGNIEANGGSFSADTVAGSPLKFRVMDGKVKVIDAKGNMATVTNADVMQSNGVVHVVNSVLMPK
jgi:uncharacterized surface protein with fasciclin (FAS1) repeats